MRTQFCYFIDYNIAEDFWCECEQCGRKLYGFVKSDDLNKLNIIHEKSTSMKIYYARPISLYNTKQENRDLATFKALGLEVINPNKEELQMRYAQEGMDVFLMAVSECDFLAFRSFPDGKISAGVVKEINKAEELGKPVLELPTITESRELSVEDTRKYLQYLGHR